MKIFGRSPGRFAAALWNLPGLLVASLRCIVLFREPTTILLCYLKRTSPESRRVSFRSGGVLHLSHDPSDIITVFLIFCRKDYGSVEAGTSVIDVGANIGVYSVYAALEGATSVHAYEPCEESFNLLQKNIIANGLERIIIPHKGVVVGKPSAPIMFPRASSVHNRIEADRQNGAEDCAPVDAIPFFRIAEDLRTPSLVKMDCEGGEYDAILHTEASVFDRVDQIRLEYHRGPKDQLFQRLAELGYERLKFTDEGVAGYLWVGKGDPD